MRIDGHTAPTPRNQLARLEADRRDREREVRQTIVDAMLTCCGEVGYRNLTVEQVYQAYGGYRSHFYRHFEGKADCFRIAYETEIERLAARLLSFASPERGCLLREALDDLAEFIVAEPLRAKGLFVEVHIAAGPSLVKRREILQRLSQALDSACRDADAPGPAPAITGEFMVGAIDHAVLSALVTGRPKDFRQGVPALCSLIAHAYRGDDKPL